MRFTRMLLMCVFALACVPSAAAQTVGTIDIGEIVSGAVSSDSAAPSYFFTAQANQALTVQLTTTAAEFMPVLLIADEQNNVLETFGESVGGRVGGTVTIPADGRYFVQVQGANGTQGEFNLSVLEGDIPLDVATPTPVPETTFEAEVTAETDAAIELHPGDTVESDFKQADRQFVFTSGDTALLLQVRFGAGSTLLAVTLTSETSGEIVGSYRSPVHAGAFVVPPSSGSYTLTVSHAEADPSLLFIVSLSQFDMGALLQPPEPTLVPSPTLLPTATVPPTSAPPQDVDALLTWSDTALMLTNISGTSLDLRMLSFTGSIRSVDMTFWAQGNPSLDLSAFPPDTCAGFRPLAYPDAPPLAPGCTDLAAWYSADIVHFWEGQSFDVRYNGAVIATCPTSDGQCGIDLPDA
jgi:hypothetical protein